MQVILLLFVLGFVSCLSTTKGQREEARRNLARWNPLWAAFIILGLAIILYPWPPYHPQY